MLAKLKTLPKDIYLLLTLFLVLPFILIPAWLYDFPTQKHAFFSLFTGVIILYYFFKKIGDKSDLKIKYTLPHLFFILFGIAALISVISVLISNPHYARSSFDAAVYILLVVFMSFVITNRFGKDFGWTEKALLVFSITGTVVAVNGVLNEFYGFDLLLGDMGDPRTFHALRSFIGNRNFVSDYLATLIPVSIYFILKKHSHRYLTIYCYINIFLMFWVVMLAQTRAVFIGFLLGAVLFAACLLYANKTPAQLEIIKSKPFLRKCGAIAFILLFLYIIFNFDTPLNRSARGGQIRRAETVVTFEADSEHKRFLAWSAAYAQFSDPEIPMHRFIGSGLSTYQIYAIHYMADFMHENPARYIDAWRNFKRTHNDYLQVLAETGAPGFIALMGMLISMFIIYVKTLKKEKSFNKLLLFCLYGWIAVIIAVHSFTEFPLHLQPNIMICVFVLSSALSDQFVTTKKITVKKPYVILVFIPVILLAATSGYLKTNNVWSEACFKNGTYHNRLFDAYENSLNNDINMGIDHYQSEVERLKEALKERDPASPAFDSINSELRQAENELERLTAAGREYYEKANHHYTEAKNAFLQSLDRNPAFGNSAYFLARLFNRVNYRKNNLKYEDLPFVFTGFREEYRHMIKEFNGSMKLMPFIGREIRRTVEPLYVQTINADIRNLLLDIQSLYDSINYFEGSFLIYSDKNSYRTIANSNYLIFRKYEYLKPLMPDKTEIIEEKQLRAYEEIHHWHSKANHILPGGWNKFTEWRDIYSKYLEINVSMLNFFDEEEILNRVIPVIEKDGLFSYHSARKGEGIPMASFKALEEMYNKLENDGLKKELTRHIVTGYGDVYGFYKKHKEEYTDLYISHEYYDTDHSGIEDGNLNIQITHTNTIDQFLDKYAKIRERL